MMGIPKLIKWVMWPDHAHLRIDCHPKAAPTFKWVMWSWPSVFQGGYSIIHIIWYCWIFYSVHYSNRLVLIRVLKCSKMKLNVFTFTENHGFHIIVHFYCRLPILWEISWPWNCDLVWSMYITLKLKRHFYVFGKWYSLLYNFVLELLHFWLAL